MTRKEWVANNHPERINTNLECIGGVTGCPADYQDMPGNKPDIDGEGCNINSDDAYCCRKCWNCEVHE